MQSFFRFYGKILPFRILQLCAKEKTLSSVQQLQSNLFKI